MKKASKAMMNLMQRKLWAPNQASPASQPGNSELTNEKLSKRSQLSKRARNVWSALSLSKRATLISTLRKKSRRLKSSNVPHEEKALHPNDRRTTQEAGDAVEVDA